MRCRDLLLTALAGVFWLPATASATPLSPPSTPGPPGLQASEPSDPPPAGAPCCVAAPDSVPGAEGAVPAEAGGPPGDTAAEPGSEEAAPLPEVTLSLSGLISATAFAQDQSFGFGNGQSAVFAASGRATDDLWFMGGDVRSTRLRLTAETLPGETSWSARGILEIDFFGAFNGTGAFNDEQPQPRLRLAYVELVRGGTTVRVGQSWTPLLGAVPVSTTHIAFPLGIGSAGLVGWRYPGLLVRQRVTGAGSPLRVSVEVGAFRGSWSGTDPDDPSQVVDHRSAGEAGIPQFEARLDVASPGGGTPWSAYLVGHLDQKDLSGVGVREDDDGLTGKAVELGGRVDHAGWHLLGNAYAGRAIGQQFGALTQFGDIGSQGGWLQVGRDLTARTGLWLFHGFEDPVDGDVRASGNARLHNRSTALSLQWDGGPYRAGLEWLRSTTRWVDAAVGSRAHGATQISFSVLYSF